MKRGVFKLILFFLVVIIASSFLMYGLKTFLRKGADTLPLTFPLVTINNANLQASRSHPYLYFDQSELEYLHAQKDNSTSNEFGVSPKGVYDQIISLADYYKRSTYNASACPFAGSTNYTNSSAMPYARIEYFSFAYAMTEDSSFLDPLKSTIDSVLLCDTWLEAAQSSIDNNLSLIYIEKSLVFAYDAVGSQLNDVSNPARLANVRKALIQKGIADSYAVMKFKQLNYDTSPIHNKEIGFAAMIGLTSMALRDNEYAANPDQTDSILRDALNGGEHSTISGINDHSLVFVNSTNKPSQSGQTNKSLCFGGECNDISTLTIDRVAWEATQLASEFIGYYQAKSTDGGMYEGISYDMASANLFIRMAEPLRRLQIYNFFDGSYPFLNNLWRYPVSMYAQGEMAAFNDVDFTNQIQWTNEMLYAAKVLGNQDAAWFVKKNLANVVNNYNTSVNTNRIFPYSFFWIAKPAMSVPDKPDFDSISFNNGIVSMRYDWSDSNPVLFFKSGPESPLDPDRGHAHHQEDNGAIALRYNNHWLLADYGKLQPTYQSHNVLGVESADTVFTNSDFEEGTQSWQNSWAATGSGSNSIDNTVSHDGANSWKFTVTATVCSSDPIKCSGNQGGYLSDYIPIDNNNSYTVSAWVKDNEPTEKYGLRLGFSLYADNSGSAPLSTRYLVSQSDDASYPNWTQIGNVDYTISNSSAHYLRVIFSGPYIKDMPPISTPITMWWDDFAVKRTKVNQTNLSYPTNTQTGDPYGAKITENYFSKEFDLTTGDQSAVYPSLESATRTVAYIKPDYMIAYDQIFATTQNYFNIPFHPENGANVSASGDGFSINAGNTSLLGKVLSNQVLTPGVKTGTPDYVNFRSVSPSNNANILSVLYPSNSADGAPSIEKINANSALVSFVDTEGKTIKNDIVSVTMNNIPKTLEGTFGKMECDGKVCILGVGKAENRMILFDGTYLRRDSKSIISTTSRSNVSLNKSEDGLSGTIGFDQPGNISIYTPPVESLKVNGQEFANFDYDPSNSLLTMSGLSGNLTIEIIYESGLTIGASKSFTYPGDVLSYDVTFENITDSNEKTIVISAPIPTNTIYKESSATNGGVFDNGNIIWSVGNLAPGESFTARFEVTVR